MTDIEAAKHTTTPDVEALPRDADGEKGDPRNDIPQSPSPTRGGRYAQLLRKVLTAGRVEERGIQPIPLQDRNSTRYFNCFTIWCSMNCNILPVTFGLMGPKYFGLSFRDSILIIIFVILFTTLFPAFLSTLGPRTGMRQMVQARFSFG